MMEEPSCSASKVLQRKKRMRIAETNYDSTTTRTIIGNNNNDNTKTKNEYSNGYTCQDACNNDNTNNATKERKLVMLTNLVERVNPQTITSKDFFQQFISLRKPCLLIGHPTFDNNNTSRSSTSFNNNDNEKNQYHDHDSKQNKKHFTWSITYDKLINIAGNQLVQVERRYNSNESFGQVRTTTTNNHRQITMLFKTFLNILVTKNNNNEDTKSQPLSKELLYLSTQEITSQNNDDSDDDEEENEQQEHQQRNNNKRKNNSVVVTEITPPCQQLIEHGIIPKHIPLMGNLILHSCNLWMGSSSSNSVDVEEEENTKTNNVSSSSSSSSSGLHHDYHDNIYILIKGKKHFRLYSPDMAHNMYVYGNIHKIYNNGLISYKGYETRQDGVPYTMLLQQNENTNHKKEKIINKDQQDKTERGQSYLNDSEDENIDESIEDENDNYILGKGADYASSNNSDNDSSEDNKQVIDWEGEDDFDVLEATHTETTTNETTTTTTTTTTRNSSKSDEKEEEDDNETKRPMNFSKILPQDLRNLEKDSKCLDDIFPSFAKCQYIDIVLNEGESLYLPCGWFHEVRSISNNNETKNIKDNNNPSLHGCHLAINYWYYPPDNLNNYSNPYKHNFLRIHNNNNSISSS